MSYKESKEPPRGSGDGHPRVRDAAAGPDR